MLTIRQRRKELGLTQKEFAVLIGKPQSSVSQWESGKFTPRGKDLPVIAKALRCKVKDLFDDEEDKHDDGAFGILSDERPEIHRTYQTQSYLRMLQRRGRSAEL